MKTQVERMLASTRRDTIGCVNVGGIRSRGALDLDIPKLPGAACKGYEPVRDFHPTARKVNVDKARAVCAGCPVKQECLDWVTDRERRLGVIEYGVWGGMTEWERQERRQAMPEKPRLCRAGLHELTEGNIHMVGKWRTCLACRRAWRNGWEKERRLDEAAA